MIDFIFPSKLRRFSFLWRVILFNLASALLLAEIFTGEQKLFSAFTITILYLYGIFFIFLPRMRDGAITRWLLLLLILPYGDKALSLLLLFKPSTLRWKTIENVPDTQAEQDAAANP